MAHSALRLYSSLCNTPHLITPSSFDAIVSYLENKDMADFAYTEHQPVSFYNQDTGIGMIDIQGALTYKSTGMEMLCGGTSYESILSQFKEMVDAGVSTIVLNVDSGGGEAYGMMETASKMRSMADANNVHLVAYVDGMSASAAYGLSVAAHEIIVNPDAEVGSVGVVVRLMNDSKALEQKGIERTFVYAGDSKVPFAADGSFREEFLADIQQKVNALYEKFTGFVAQMRNMDVSAVKGTQAKVFMADEAMKLGMVDKVMSRDEFVSYLASNTTESKNKKEGGGMLKSLFSMSHKEDDAEMAQLEALQAQMASMSAEWETKLAELSAGYEQKLQGVAAEMAALVEQKEAAEAALAAIQKEAAEQKVAKRQAALEAVVGTVKAGELMPVTAGMDDAGFDVILKSLSVAQDSEKQKDDFKELGVSGEAEKQTEATDYTAAIIKAKYSTK